MIPSSIFSQLRLSREEMNPRGGCLCKLPGLRLEDLLEGAYASAFGKAPPPHPMIQPEDCAQIQVDSRQILLSADFGPLVGVDLRKAGRIAALHAFTDVFACGGTPSWALAFLTVKEGDPIEFYEDVLAGMLEAAASEETLIVGGHTSLGAEAMAGLAVVGTVGTRFLPKANAKTGDLLFLSKPLGTGLAVRAYKLGLITDSALQDALVPSLTSNRAAGLAAVAAPVNSATDISGFGFLGHLTELLPKGNGAEIYRDQVPIIPAITKLDLLSTFWTDGNADYARARRRLTGNTTRASLTPLLDPQTNGGLLVSAPEACQNYLRAHGFVEIGYVTDLPEIHLA